MRTLQHSYRGLSLVVELNADRLFSVIAICAALASAAALTGL